ncbi:MAG: MoxR family ATPase [Clostridia bacterium]|jgi:MoxR-like ATPase|nr:MoxR family ATPase [Clostridia bacterium]
MVNQETILNEVKKAVVGKDDVLSMAFMAILARGHILVEDIPGVGKTTMALAFSKALGLEYHRVQFTPDVLPSDIVGFSLPDKQTGEMIYKPGAILCNLFLADELNRATSRTQSALLEAMEEGRVTVDGITHEVPDPFIVIATQNPVGSSGTQLLPESQLDRFMVRLSLGYPDAEAELDLLRRKQEGNPLDKVRFTVNSRELAEMRSQVDGVYVDKKIFDYVIRLSAASRKHPAIVHGASPRASIAVVSMSKAAAFIEGRDYVIPDDVKAVYPATITHRLLLNAESKAAGKTQRAVLDEIVSSTPAPSAK